MSILFKIFYILFFTTNIAFTASNALVHSVTLFTLQNQTGLTQTFNTKLFDLSTFTDFLLETKSVCATGHWRIYGEPNYEGSLLGFGSDVGTFCLDDTNRFRDAQSMRYFGSLDTSTKAITFINGSANHNWEGRELIIENLSANNFGFIPQVGIITGGSSWTMYSDNNFGGNSTCINPGDNEWHVFNAGIMQFLSVTQGCNN